jgi:hypothetical protein
MSDGKTTYSSVIETLDRLSAPPGENIAERILALRQELLDAAARAVVAEREKLDAAMAALNAADLYVNEGTLATGIEGLARRRDDAVERADLAERQSLAVQGLCETLQIERKAERERAIAAERRAVNLENEAHQLRAETQRQQAQLDWAAEQFQAALRRGA